MATRSHLLLVSLIKATWCLFRSLQWRGLGLTMKFLIVTLALLHQALALGSFASFSSFLYINFDIVPDRSSKLCFEPGTFLRWKSKCSNHLSRWIFWYHGIEQILCQWGCQIEQSWSLPLYWTFGGWTYRLYWFDWVPWIRRFGYHNHVRALQPCHVPMAQGWISQSYRKSFEGIFEWYA